MPYNVFIDDVTTGKSVEAFNVASPYDASALANAFTDAGYRVETDLWSATVPDAMISPDVWRQYTLRRYPRLLRGY